MADKVKVTSSFTNESWEGEVELAGATDMQKLGALFRLFNRVEDEDTVRLERIGYRLPSLSAGDRVVLNERVYRVDAGGFSLDDRDPREPLKPWPLDREDA